MGCRVRAQTSPPCRSALAALSCWAGRRLSQDPQAHGPLPYLGLPTGSLLLAAAAPGARSKPAGAAGQPQHQPVRLQARRACPAPLAALLSVEQSPRAEPEHERRPQAVPCAAARPDTDSPVPAAAWRVRVQGSGAEPGRPTRHALTRTRHTTGPPYPGGPPAWRSRGQPVRRAPGGPLGEPPGALRRARLQDAGPPGRSRARTAPAPEAQPARAQWWTTWPSGGRRCRTWRASTL